MPWSELLGCSSDMFLVPEFLVALIAQTSDKDHHTILLLGCGSRLAPLAASYIPHTLALEPLLASFGCGLERLLATGGRNCWLRFASLACG